MTMPVQTMPREQKRPTRSQTPEVEKNDTRDQRPLWQERIRQESGE